MRADSRIVLAYNPPPSALEDDGRAWHKRMSRLASEMGEPWISLFTPADAEALLHRCGFGSVDHFGPAEAISHLLRGPS